jgi:hypothetical protein
LAASTARHRNYSDAEPFPVGYKSTILGQFIEWIEPWKDAQILDAGPVCQENITFFARRMSRHYACDMFIRLHRALVKQPGFEDICKHLDYPPHSFDGVQLWDLVDHLDDDQAGRLVERCHEMLRDTGLLMLLALEKKPEPADINTFVIGRDYQLGIRLQHHLKLPWYCRHNRALISLLAEFDFVKSFRYRNGLREFLFQKPGLVRD